MRFVTLDSREVGGRPGLWLPSGDILDLASAPGTLASTQWLPQSVVSVLAQGEEGLARMSRLVTEVESAAPPARVRMRAEGTLIPYAGTELLTPVRRPGLLLMLGSRDLAAAGALAGSYIKNPNSAAGPGARVALPGDREDRLAATPMLGLVLGRALYTAGVEEAARALAAYTLVADLGVATDGRTAGECWADGRQFPGACPIGPALITTDEFGGSGPLAVGMRVNGHGVGQTLWDPRPSAFGPLLAAVSRSYALRPGDIVAIRSAADGQETTVGRGDRIALALGDAMELTFSIVS